MLDPKTLKVGSVVKMEGKVVNLSNIAGGRAICIHFTGDAICFPIEFSDGALEHAELVSNPLDKLTKEQSKAIKEAYEKRFKVGCDRDNPVDFSDWIDEHTEK